MVIALATDDRSLQVFASVESALAYCEGIDVEDGVWRFWDGAGSALQPVFSQPNERGRFSIRNGTYRLEPAVASAPPPLEDELSRGVHMGPNAYFPSVESLLAHLAQSTRVTQHGA